MEAREQTKERRYGSCPLDRLSVPQQRPRQSTQGVTDVPTGASELYGLGLRDDYPEAKHLRTYHRGAKDERAEQDIDHNKMIENVLECPNDKDEKDAIGLAVATICKEFEVSAVVCEGDFELGMKISQFRPASDVIMAVATNAEARSLAFAWGVQPVVGKYADALAYATKKLALDKGSAILKVTAKGIEFTTTK